MTASSGKLNDLLSGIKLSSRYKKLSKSILPKSDSIQALGDDLINFANNGQINSASVEYASLNKMMALTCLATGQEVKAINHLAEAHAILHRHHVNLRFIKAELKEQIRAESVKYGINPNYMKFDVNRTDGPNSLKEKLSELPPEWYIVQVTQPYDLPKTNLVASMSQKNQQHTHALHLTLLSTDMDSFCLTVPKPPCDMYDICKVIKDLLDRNKTDLGAEYRNNSLYWKMRAKQNEKMKGAVSEMEFNWLKEWRILFIADPVKPCALTLELHCMIDKLITDDTSGNEISPKTRWLLKKIATCSYCLSKAEIQSAVSNLLINLPKLCKNIVLSIFGQLPYVSALQTLKRKPLVLIVDEYLDYIPFEAISLLRGQPVTRFPCIHVAYAMFKEHEATMEDGCKIVKLSDKTGTFIINPSSNLPKMEKRLRVFLDYWLPDWAGIYNKKPNETEFSSALVDHDLLMYNGHGSGIQYLAGEHIERLRVTSTVLLFGCSSVKLFPVGGRFPPYGVSNQYLIASSPCVMGMLWEVTDVDTDKMTASFISNWIPSKAAKPWSQVNIDQWVNGVLRKCLPVTSCDDSAHCFEPEMLRALANAKLVCSQYMTAAAVVVRGLPIKLKY